FLQTRPKQTMVDQVDPELSPSEDPIVDDDSNQKVEDLMDDALAQDAFLNDETRDQLKAETATFKELGVSDQLCEAAASLKWTKPSKIQVEAIPVALQGRDVIGLAETGSGKTGAFVIPILQNLLEAPQRLYALILTPT